MSVTVYSAQAVGLGAQPISVEVDVSPGLHVFSIVGLADKEIQESRQRIAAAIKNLGGLAPHKKSQRVIVNLAPADIKKEGPAFDLPIALGYLLASKQLGFNPQGKIFLAELGLDGTLRKVPGVLPMALAARTAGFSQIILPQGNGAEAAILDGIEVREAESLYEVVEHLSGTKEISPLPQTQINSAPPEVSTDLSDIRGQESAKRALEIAAAGEHNLLFCGPPGAGKTILAKTLPSILPPLSFAEALEITKIYSIHGLLDEKTPFVYTRPFRSPHHTSSYTAVIGGGSYPRPGEATLAHRGVLFLDEFPEFDRRVIEALRQPLEEKAITVARSSGVETFPAQFILVAAMNPCPCGNLDNPRKDCVCSPGAAARYKRRVSGPILDRIDLHVEVPQVPYEQLAAAEDSSVARGAPKNESSKEVRENVERAREVQKQRFRGRDISTNGEMGLKEIKEFIKIGEPIRQILKLAHEKYGLSARAYHRLLKLSRTIADLNGSDDIQREHVLEALSYRPKLE